ncbi:MAG: MarR family winged helix-turn-helix transcriptional regulator [Thermoanaerobaculum sp.]
MSERPIPLIQKHDDPVAKTLAALERLARLVLASQWEAGFSQGITALQLAVLETLATRRGTGVRELAAHLRLSRATVSRAVQSLKGKGFVVDEPEPGDRRRVRLALTPAGENALIKTAAWAHPLQEAVASLAPSTQDHFWQALLELLKALEVRGLMAQTRMCLACRFFVPAQGEGAEAYCRLLEKTLSWRELRLDCPDFEPAEFVSKT